MATRSQRGMHKTRADHGARQLRRAAESSAARPHMRDSAEVAQDDARTADAHNELTHPDESKGRPATGKRRASNAGNDGP